METTMEQKVGHVCPWWLAYTFDNFLRRLVHPAERTLAPFVAKGMRVADIGCGFGHFSLGMANLVGGNGRVFAVDMQAQMLVKTMKRARKLGLEERIEPVLCSQSNPRLPQGLDFILASNMLHEVPGQAGLIGQIKTALNPDGIFYLMEPKGHLNANKFQREVNLVIDFGLEAMDQTKLAREHCMVFRKQEVNSSK